MTTVRVGSQEVEEDDLVRYSWATGAFLEERLDPLQLELDRTIESMRPRTKIFILESRKIGKTFGALCYIDKFARRHPNCIIRMAFPTKLQGKTIILPIMEEMQQDCPAEYRWVNREAQDGCWILPHTGARLYLAGTDDADQIDRLRGPKADLLVLDEVPTFNAKNLTYLINSVLWPQTLNTGGRMLMFGTPPKTMDHPSVDLIRSAEVRGLLIVKTIFDNPRLSAEVIREICEEANPGVTPEEIDEILAGRRKGTPHWEREFMCRMVADDDSRVTPEFDISHVQQISTGIPTTKFVFIDPGHVKDYFAVVFAEIDFINQKLRCLAEYSVLRRDTGSIIKDLRKIEKFLGWENETVTRYMDQTANQQIYDFNTQKDPEFPDQKPYHVVAAMKSPGKGQLVVDLKNLLKQDRILVRKSCKKLILCMTDGIWTDNTKEDFKRSPTLGHLDLLDALAQGCMMLRQHGKWQVNPYPKGEYQGFVPGETKPEKLLKNKDLTSSKSIGYTVMKALMPRRRYGHR